MTLGVLVSLTLVCVLNVRGKSTLGRTFFITEPLYVEHTGLVTVFTYNYDVTLTTTYNLVALNCDPPHNNTEKNVTFLERHVPRVFEVTTFELLERCKKNVFFYYLITGTDDFGVNVMYRGFDGSVSTYTAYPARAFGKSYRLFLLRSNQFYGVFVPKKKSHIFLPGNFTVNKNDDILRWVIMNSYSENEYKPMYLCDHSDRSKTDPLSIIAKNVTVSKGVAVFTGNCHTKALVTDQACDTLSDATLEMLLSTDYASKQFIVFHVGPRSASSSYVAAVTVDNDLDVTLFVDDEVNRTYSVKIGEFVEIPVTYNTFHLLVGSVVFQAYVVSASACVSDRGTPSMTSVIPTVLFFNQYIWSIQAKMVKLESLVLVLIKKSRAVYGFQFDNQDININSNWTKVKGDNEYSGAFHRLDVNDQEVHTIISSKQRPFGCYIYGRGERHSFLHFVGFMTARIYQPWEPCEPSRMKPGDLLDNDCDGRFDEESSETTDDDGDGKKGEDIIFAVPVYFSKFSQPDTRPPKAIETTPSTMTPWDWEDATEPPTQDRSLPLILLLLLLIPILSSLLYYMLRKKRQPLPIAEELTPENESRVDPPVPSVSKISQKKESFFSLPGRVKSTYLH